MPVTNTPDVLNDDVADLGFGLVIACLREMPKGFAYVKSGDSGAQGMMHLTTTLSGKTIGIVGLGRIGREIADRARAFKMRVAYTGRRAGCAVRLRARPRRARPPLGRADADRPGRRGDPRPDRRG